LEFLLCTLTPEVQCLTFQRLQCRDNYFFKIKFVSFIICCCQHHERIMICLYIFLMFLLCTLTPEVQCLTFHRNHVIWPTKITKCWRNGNDSKQPYWNIVGSGIQFKKTRYQLNYFICIKDLITETITSLKLNLFSSFIYYCQHRERKTMSWYISVIRQTVG
jgi:hypothetical protein